MPLATKKEKEKELAIFVICLSLTLSRRFVFCFCLGNASFCFHLCWGNTFFPFARIISFVCDWLFHTLVISLFIVSLLMSGFLIVVHYAISEKPGWRRF